MPSLFLRYMSGDIPLTEAIYRVVKRHEKWHVVDLTGHTIEEFPDKPAAEKYARHLSHDAKVISERVGDRWEDAEYFKNREFEINGRYFHVTGQVNMSFLDDSDYDREHGYGPYIHREVTSVDIDKIMEITDENGTEVDVTGDPAIHKLISDKMEQEAYEGELGRI